MSDPLNKNVKSSIKYIYEYNYNNSKKNKYKLL